MTMNRVLLSVAALLICGVGAPAETGVFDAGGRMTAILNQGEELAIRTDLILPVPGATPPAGLGQSRARPSGPERGSPDLDEHGRCGFGKDGPLHSDRQRAGWQAAHRGRGDD